MGINGTPKKFFIARQINHDLHLDSPFKGKQERHKNFIPDNANAVITWRCCDEVSAEHTGNDVVHCRNNLLQLNECWNIASSKIFNLQANTLRKIV